MRKLLLSVLFLSLTLTVSAIPQKGGHTSHSSSRSTTETKSATKSKSSTSDKPVHVREYERKDGTVVQAHDRALPGTNTKTSPPTGAKDSGSQTESQTTTTAIPKPSTVAARNGKGRIQRSAAARDQ